MADLFLSLTIFSQQRSSTATGYLPNTHQTYQTISNRLFLMGIPGKEPWNLKTAPNVKLKASSG